MQHLPRRRQAQLKRLREILETMAGRVRQVVRQTRARMISRRIDHVSMEYLVILRQRIIAPWLPHHLSHTPGHRFQNLPQSFSVALAGARGRCCISSNTPSA